MNPSYAIMKNSLICVKRDDLLVNVSPRKNSVPSMLLRAAGTFALSAAGIIATAAIVKLTSQARAAQDVHPTLRHPSIYTSFDIVDPATLALARAQNAPSSKPPAGVRISTVTFASEDGHDVEAFLYEPINRFSSGAVLWLHGGGTIMGHASRDHDEAGRIAQALGVSLLSVDYRKAPEHPFPLPFQDAYAGLKWLHENAEERGIEPQRIAVVGPSAGGLLAAAVVQRAVDEGVPVSFQGLIAPMLDDRTCLREATVRGHVGWSSASNSYAWSAYLNTAPGVPRVPEYSVPARRENLRGLPPAWIGVGDVDLFYDEDLEYARRLEEAGVPVRLEAVAGMYHGAESLMPHTSMMRSFWDSFLRTLRPYV